MEDPLQNVYKTQETHCRLCAEPKTYTEVLDLSSDVKTFAEYLKIIDYLNLDYLDLAQANRLPKTTCEKCHDTFQESYNFIKKLNENQFILKAIYDTNVKLGPKEIEISSDDDSDNSKTIGKMERKSEQTKLAHCRFCAEEMPTEVLTNLSENKTKHSEYLKITNFLLRNWQKHKKLPKMSCAMCHQTLQSIYTFFRNIKVNQDILNRLYITRLKPEPNRTITIKIEDVNEDIDADLNALYPTEPSDTNPLTFCMVSINTSWKNYPWKCCHCLALFDTAEDLRSHSKEKHTMCYAFSCADCADEFSSFNEFVEHVRRHRDDLRLNCQFCNESFETEKLCGDHVTNHYMGTGKICELCGEMLPYANTLAWHRQMYGQSTSEKSKRNHERSWDDYDWACQDCPMTVADIDALRAHTQTRHDKCFAMKCMDCSKVTKTFKAFVDHVITHRSYLRNFCPYCNLYCEDMKELNQHILNHITSQQRPCNICGQRFMDNIALATHKKTFAGSTYKPVQEARTSKRNVKKLEKTKRKRVKRTLSSEDLKCKICSKLFQHITNLNKHLKTHEFRSRNFVCQTCGRAFLTNASLKDHAITHNSVKSEVCQVCNKEFHTKHKLKAHIVTHLELRPFVCDECGNSFKSKKRLKCHLTSHSDVKPYKCMYCFKEFKYKENLKTHEHQHTGVRPYKCEMCEKTFTNWTNCNKHMIRKHGVTLAKTKITAQGRISINRRTGEAKTIASDKNAKEWLDQMLKPVKPGRKK